jgi:hypothetical protein
MVLLLAYGSTKAQDKCESPLFIMPDSVYNVSASNGCWLEFEATHDTMSLFFHFDNPFSNATLSLTLQPNCTSPAIFSDTIFSSTGAILLYNLSNGFTYMLYLASDDTTYQDDLLLLVTNGYEPEVLESDCITQPPQCELVCNGNFEDLELNVPVQFPLFYPPLYRMNRWDSAPRNRSAGSADGFWFDGVNGNVPLISGYTAPFGRNSSYGIAGFMLHTGFMNDPLRKEYMQTKLIAQMKPGHLYMASLWLRHYEKSNWQMDQVGMLFTQNVVSQPFNGYIIPLTPQIEVRGQVFTDSWTQVSELVKNTTNDNWEYLTVGVFNNDPPAVDLNLPPGNQVHGGYYFFDDVSVVEVPSAGSDFTVCSGDEVFLGVFDCTLPSGASVYWTDINNIFISNSFPLPTSVTHPQTFVLHVNFNGFYYTDTVKVSVVCCNNSADYIFMNSDYATNGFATNNTISNASVVINQTFTFDKSMSFTNTHFLMGPNALMDVLPGNDLIFENCILESCDGFNMWEGILLQSTASITVDETTIKDAITAITSTNGANITSAGSEFINNYTGLHLLPFAGSHPITVHNSSFKKTAPLLAPFASSNRAFAGVHIESVTNCDIGDEALQDVNERNVFEQMEYGIKAIRTNMNINGNYFYQCLHGAFLDGDYFPTSTLFTLFMGNHGPFVSNEFVQNTNGITLRRGIQAWLFKNDFNQNQTGVHISNQPLGHEFAIHGNHFLNNHTGITLLELVKPTVLVESNTFDYNLATGHGEVAVSMANVVPPSLSWIPTLPTDSLGYVAIKENEIKNHNDGIVITNIAKPVVVGNNIENVPANWNRITHGIKLYNCPRAHVYFNLVAGVNTNLWAAYGIASDFAKDNLIEGNCVKDLGRALWLGGYSGGAKLYHNLMRDCQTGFFANHAFIGTQARLIDLGTQMAMLPSDNMWEGQFSNHLFNFHPIGNNAFGLRTPSSLDFDPRHNPTSINNNSYLGLPILLFNQSVTSTAFQFHLPVCEEVNLGFGIENDAVVGLTPEEIAIIADTSSLQTYDPDSIAIQWLQLQSLYIELVQDTIDYSNHAMLASFVGGLSVENIGEIEDIDELIRVGIEEGGLNEFAIAYNANLALQTTELPAQATAMFNDIYLHQLEVHSYNYTLDSLDLYDLNYLAALCPYIYGTAVYQARALLSMANSTGTSPQYISPCEMGYVNGTAKTNQMPLDAKKPQMDAEGKMTLYPNPNAGTAFVTFESDQKFSLELIVTDITGSAVHRLYFQSGETVLLDLAHLPNGMYVATLFYNNETWGREKIIINK